MPKARGYIKLVFEAENFALAWQAIDAAESAANASSSGVGVALIKVEKDVEEAAY